MAKFDKFGLVMIVVRDMERSVDFYRDVLKLKLEFATPHWSQFNVGGVTLGLHPETEQLKVTDTKPQTCQFGFYIEDIEATFADLTSKGAKSILAPKQEEFGKLAIVGDPDGYAIQLCQLAQR